MSRTSDVKRIKRLAHQQGWRVEICKRTAHLRFIPPDPSKQIVVTPGSSSSTRGWLDFLADLRRNGLELPDRAKKTSA